MADLRPLCRDIARIPKTPRDGNMGLIGGSGGRRPKQIADELAGKQFSNFGQLRSAFWKSAAGNAELASQFSKQNLGRMRRGLAPRAVPGQQVGKQMSYVLHHVKPINQGGSVYDLGNIMVMTPRYHQEVLSRSYHFGN